MLEPCVEPLSAEERNELLKQLRESGSESDRIICDYLGIEDFEWITADFERAVTLIPSGLPFLVSRNENGDRYWCDVGKCPQVQAWGRTAAAAVAGAAFAYHTHPRQLANDEAA